MSACELVRARELVRACVRRLGAACSTQVPAKESGIALERRRQTEKTKYTTTTVMQQR